ncbi:MAG: hypothetical protein HYY17_04860 [Planctomycetes bacterium]|nr:hypothetical protein [Planctomycetota bacterium]
MMKHARWVALAGAIAYLAGCGPNKGELWADKVNEKITAKIKAGQVKTELDLAFAKVDAMTESMKELKLETITESEKNKFDEKMAKYEENWKKLIAEKKS